MPEDEFGKGSLYEEAGITECDLMDYAKKVMANPDYFAEEEEDDD